MQGYRGCNFGMRSCHDSAAADPGEPGRAAAADLRLAAAVMAATRLAVPRMSMASDERSCRSWPWRARRTSSDSTSRRRGAAVAGRRGGVASSSVPSDQTLCRPRRDPTALEGLRAAADASTTPAVTPARAAAAAKAAAVASAARTGSAAPRPDRAGLEVPEARGRNLSAWSTRSVASAARGVPCAGSVGTMGVRSAAPTVTAVGAKLAGSRFRGLATGEVLVREPARGDGRAPSRPGAAPIEGRRPPPEDSEPGDDASMGKCARSTPILALGSGVVERDHVTESSARLDSGPGPSLSSPQPARTLAPDSPTGSVTSTTVPRDGTCLAACT